MVYIKLIFNIYLRNVICNVIDRDGYVYVNWNNWVIEWKLKNYFYLLEF